MYALIRSLPPRRLLLEQGPAFLLALTITELLYKFHSFILEAMGFLTTWFVLDFLIQLLVSRRRSSRTAGHPRA